MNRSEILEQINALFRDVLDEDEVVLTEETTAQDVEGWDSLTHVQLVVAVEKHFGLKFPAREISEFRNVADLVQAVENRR